MGSWGSRKALALFVLVAIVLVGMGTGGKALAAEFTVDPAGGADFTTIAEAVAAADASPDASDTISCAAGVYPHEGNTGITLGKPVTLLGAQAGVDGRGRGPSGAGPETVMPATTSDETSSDEVFILASNDITIDGFYFPDMGPDGFYSETDVDRLTIRNTIFKSTTGTPTGGNINLAGGGASADDFLFERNFVQNLIAGAHSTCYMLNLGHTMNNATIRDNFINGAGFAYGPFEPTSGWLIEGNEFDGYPPGEYRYFGVGFGAGAGVYANLGDAVIRGNRIVRMNHGLGKIVLVGGSIISNVFDDNHWGGVNLIGAENTVGGVSSRDVLVQDNAFLYNGAAYNTNITWETPDVESSPGLVIRSGVNASTIHLRLNGFDDLGYGSSEWAWGIRHRGDNAADAEHNWWTTTDPGQIFQMAGQEKPLPVWHQRPVDFDPYLVGISYTGKKVQAGPSAVVLEATVNGSAGLEAGVPVRFSVGGMVVGSAVTGANGVARYRWEAPAVGRYSVRASCAGDLLRSAVSTVTVLSEPAASSVSITSSRNPSLLSQETTFTATVSPAQATGDVSFFDGQTALGAAPVVAGVAQLAVSGLSAGTHQITATYGGDLSYAQSTSQALEQVVADILPTPTVTALNGGETVARGDVVPLSWTLAPTASAGVMHVYAYTPGGGYTWLATRSAVAGQDTYTYDWTVTQAPGTNYTIRVWYVDGAGNWVAFDGSDAMFTIAAGSIPTVTAPNVPGTVNQGDVVPLSWTLAPPTGAGVMHVYAYTPGGGYTWLATRSAVAGQDTYTYDWTVTQAPGTSYTIRVWYVDGAGNWVTFDGSDAMFTIAAGSMLTVTAPNVPGTVYQGDVVPLSWTLAPPTGAGVMHVYAYTPSGGYLWLATRSAVAGQGTYTYQWPVTQAPGTNYTIRVWYVDGAGNWVTFDGSDAMFTIAAG